MGDGQGGGRGSLFVGRRSWVVVRRAVFVGHPLPPPSPLSPEPPEGASLGSPGCKPWVFVSRSSCRHHITIHRIAITVSRSSCRIHRTAIHRIMINCPTIPVWEPSYRDHHTTITLSRSPCHDPSYHNHRVDTIASRSPYHHHRVQNIVS